MVTETRWQIEGDYFENCNCDFVCPCLISPAPPLTSTPTKGACEVAIGFHVDRGNFGGVSLDELNLGLIARARGPMGEGDWSVALYVDGRANEVQRNGLHAIFSGQSRGPVGALAPLISTVLGVKTAPITYASDGRCRYRNVMQIAVQAVPSLKLDGSEIQISGGHPFAPEQLTIAVGESGSTYSDYGMRWDNSGKNGHYAPIGWSNSQYPVTR